MTDEAWESWNQISEKKPKDEPHRKCTPMGFWKRLWFRVMQWFDDGESLYCSNCGARLDGTD